MDDPTCPSHQTEGAACRIRDNTFGRPGTIPPVPQSRFRVASAESTVGADDLAYLPF